MLDLNEFEYEDYYEDEGIGMDCDLEALLQEIEDL